MRKLGNKCLECRCWDCEVENCLHCVSCEKVNNLWFTKDERERKKTDENSGKFEACKECTCYGCTVQGYKCIRCFCCSNQSMLYTTPCKIKEYEGVST